MLILVVDTAGVSGGVLLAKYESSPSGEIKILGASDLEPRKFSTQLISSIAEIFQANQFQLSDLAALAVVSGPGSFTGLRVGLSAVKAMAEVTGKPVIAVSRLAMMAAAVDGNDLPEAAVHAVLDAGRGEFYHGIYRDAGRTCIAESLQTLATLTASFQNVPGRVVASEAAVVDAIRPLTGVALQPIPLVTAREALPLVLAAWQAKGFSDIARLDANYLRRIDPGMASKSTSVPQSADTRSSL